MKKSIKTAALGLLALGMLAGCSKEAPVKSKWSKAEDESIREVLYGQSLPYVSGVKDLQLEASTKFGEVSISGGKATPKVLEKYAAKFTSEEGWYSLDEEEENVAAAAFKAEEEPVLSYNFEKEVETLEGTRFITVQFGSVGEDLKFVVDGDFRLIANDPYLYEFPSDYLSAAIASIFASTVEVPEIDARRYVWDDESYVVYCDIPNGTTVEADYKAALEKEGWVVWFDDYNELWTANAPDKAFSIYYIYEEGTMLIGLYTVEVEPSETFPGEFLENFYLSSGFHGLVELPDYTIASEDGYFQSDYSALADYGQVYIYAVNSTRDEMMGFVGELAEAGWTCTADKYGDYTCTLVSGWSQAVLKIADYTDPEYLDEDEDPYIMFIAQVGAVYADSEAFPTDATNFFLNAGFQGAQVAPYATSAYEAMIAELEKCAGAEFDPDFGCIYIEEVKGAESLLGATEMLAGLLAESDIFEENVEPEETVDDWGDPMGYASFYAGICFEARISVFEYEAGTGIFSAALTIAQVKTQYSYTHGFGVLSGFALDTLEVDVYDSTYAEMVAYAESMEALGWTFEEDDYGDLSGYMEEVPGVYCYIGDYTDFYGCIVIQYYYIASASTALYSLASVFGMPSQIQTGYMFYVETTGTVESVLEQVCAYVPTYTLGYSSVQALPDPETGEPTEELFGLGEFYSLDSSWGIQVQVFDNSENEGEGAVAVAIYVVALA